MNNNLKILKDRYNKIVLYGLMVLYLVTLMISIYIKAYHFFDFIVLIIILILSFGITVFLNHIIKERILAGRMKNRFLYFILSHLVSLGTFVICIYIVLNSSYNF